MTKQVDMTPGEFREAAAALCASIGPKAEISCFVNTGEILSAREHLSGYLRPDGWKPGLHTDIGCTAATFRGVLDGLAAAWEQHKADHFASTIKKMALAVIEITNDLGECSDRALRGHGFSAHDVQTHHAAAANLANEMSGKGPFSVLLSTGANEPAEAA